jgi:cytochrome P450 family 628
MSQVSSNTLALHRDANNFTEPLRFEPLRWNEGTRDPSWKHDPRAFIPFTGGTFSCAGRALALLELRFFTVKLMKRFDFDLAPGFDQEYFWTSVKSYQSLIKTHMDVVIKSREPVKE